MRHISTNSSTSVMDLELQFSDIYQHPYFPMQYQEDIRKANLLLLPSENIRENLEPVFPETTSEFLRYLRSNAPESVIPDIIADDEHYHKILLHAPYIVLPTIFIKKEILEQTAALIVGFLDDLADRNYRYTNEMDAFVNLIVDASSFCKKIMFSGRVSELKDALDSAVSQINRGGKDDAK